MSRWKKEWLQLNKFILQTLDSAVLSTTDIVIVLENNSTARHPVAEESKVTNDIWIENEETCI